jgi:hypothetical protein
VDVYVERVKSKGRATGWRLGACSGRVYNQIDHELESRGGLINLQPRVVEMQDECN